uniref:Uncharacterized protein n=1 Tax=Entomoneis paludosa TaxID=265537 RepID=A0A6U3F3E4_9STRA
MSDDDKPWKAHDTQSGENDGEDVEAPQAKRAKIAAAAGNEDDDEEEFVGDSEEDCKDEHRKQPSKNSPGHHAKNALGSNDDSDSDSDYEVEQEDDGSSGDDDEDTSNNSEAVEIENEVATFSFRRNHPNSNNYQEDDDASDREDDGDGEDEGGSNNINEGQSEAENGHAQDGPSSSDRDSISDDEEEANWDISQANSDTDGIEVDQRNANIISVAVFDEIWKNYSLYSKHHLILNRQALDPIGCKVLLFRMKKSQENQQKTKREGNGGVGNESDGGRERDADAKNVDTIAPSSFTLRYCTFPSNQEKTKEIVNLLVEILAVYQQDWETIQLVGMGKLQDTREFIRYYNMFHRTAWQTQPRPWDTRQSVSLLPLYECISQSPMLDTLELAEMDLQTPDMGIFFRSWLGSSQCRLTALKLCHVRFHLENVWAGLMDGLSVLSKKLTLLQIKDCDTGGGLLDDEALGLLAAIGLKGAGQDGSCLKSLDLSRRPPREGPFHSRMGVHNMTTGLSASFQGTASTLTLLANILAQLPCLERLNLSSHDLIFQKVESKSAENQDSSGDDHYQVFIEALIQHPRLKMINLVRCGIDNERAVLLLLTLANKKEASVESLDLRHNPFQGQLPTMFFNQLPKNLYQLYLPLRSVTNGADHFRYRHNLDDINAYEATKALTAKFRESLFQNTTLLDCRCCRGDRRRFGRIFRRNEMLLRCQGLLEMPVVLWPLVMEQCQVENDPTALYGALQVVNPGLTGDDTVLHNRPRIPIPHLPNLEDGWGSDPGDDDDE